MYLIRKIRKTRWYNSEEVSWLPHKDLQSDVFNDLQTVSNELSVFFVDENKSDLDRVIAAISANSQHPSNIDIAIFNREILSDIGIKNKKTIGCLPDDWVNDCHLILYELSATQLLQLAISIKSNAILERTEVKQIENFVAESMKMGWINREKMKWGTSDLEKIDVIINSQKQ